MYVCGVYKLASASYDCSILRCTVFVVHLMWSMGKHGHLFYLLWVSKWSVVGSVDVERCVL